MSCMVCAGRRMPTSTDHEKFYGWLEKRCFAAWHAALYFGGSTRDISLVPALAGA